ncbi:hypothetical protein MCA2286 [Methylococcus capsulatus str. Bath]|uniref:Uncharacterized protein n=1 Tax=Methylococcus capsulatus (strain ATCC 33009 / NCIMB 11132 / Bath) TaxID=243233 RepID=Q605J6_METCA|nr:hypothetical protein MCA2286 [Methylococcus capsulatus str. Bath]
MSCSSSLWKRIRAREMPGGLIPRCLPRVPGPPGYVFPYRCPAASTGRRPDFFVGEGFFRNFLVQIYGAGIDILVLRVPVGHRLDSFRGFEHFVEERQIAVIQPLTPVDLFLQCESPRKPLRPQPLQQCHRDAGVFGYFGHGLPPELANGSPDRRGSCGRPASGASVRSDCAAGGRPRQGESPTRQILVHGERENRLHPR